MLVERYQGTWETLHGPGKICPVGGTANKGPSKLCRESDHLVVLRGRESRLQGEGDDMNAKPEKETSTGQQDRT